VVFAGQASATRFFGDVWAYDPVANTWRELPRAGDVPVPRYGTCSGLGPDGRLWISHGFTEDGVRFFDTKAYDFELERWTDLTTDSPRPVDRCLHACWWTSAGTFALYGGQTTGVPALGDLWTLAPDADPDTPGRWTQGVANPPPDRALTAFTAFGDHELVFGGRALDRTYLADGYLVDGTGAFGPLTTAGTGPPARASATLISDPTRERALLFGGIDSTGGLADLWSLSHP
jgi:hypothetical protein